MGHSRSEQSLIRLSKFMSWILRHDPDKFGIVLDAEGFTPISELLAAIQRERASATEEELRAVVDMVEPQKQRFSIVGDEIRANYGHSLDGKISHEVATPPAVLFHGTAIQAIPSILSEGIRPMNRQFVHLTPNAELARRVGGRHGSPRLLRVDADTAHREGIVFHKANRSFWLVQHLPPKYLSMYAPPGNMPNS